MNGNEWKLPEVTWIHLPIVDSTNSAINRQDWGLHPTTFRLLSADVQTAGVGQHGTHWEAAKGENLLFSLGLQPLFVPPSQQFGIAICTALALYETLYKQLAPSGEADFLRIKWPNDIYWRNRKLCGTLIQHSLTSEHIEQTCIGIGLNVHQNSFSSCIPNPISLWHITGLHYDRSTILHNFIIALSSQLETLRLKGINELNHPYTQHLYWYKELRPYSTANKTFCAKLLGVDTWGRLRLMHLDGTINTYGLKEITYVQDPPCDLPFGVNPCCSSI